MSEEKKREKLAKLLAEEWKQREKFAGKSLNELLAEIFLLADEMEQLYKSGRDGEEIKAEIDEKWEHLRQLFSEFTRRPIEAEYFRKWSKVLGTVGQLSMMEEDRHVAVHRKTFESNKNEWENIENLNKEAKSKNLSMEEYLQWETFAGLNQMIFHNLKSSAEVRKRSIDNNMPALRFQAETAEVMLKVREEQAKTANILEKVESQQKRTGDILKGVEDKQQKVLEEQKAAHWKYLILTVVAILGTNIISNLTAGKPLVAVLLFFVFALGAIWVVRKI